MSQPLSCHLLQLLSKVYEMMKRERKKRKKRVLPYLQAIPDILKYQLVSKTALGVLLFVLKAAMLRTLHSTGRVAVSSGDYMFLFTTWQGILLIAMALVSLFLYVTFDLNTMILFSGKRLKQENTTVWACMKESIAKIRRFFCPAGIGIVLYIALLAPILGFGISISLTENLYIPTFITSVIETTPLYNTLYTIAIIVFTLIGFANLFSLHGILLEDLPVKGSLSQSRTLMKKNWKSYIRHNLSYLLLFGLIMVLLAVLLLVLPLMLLPLVIKTEGMYRGMVLAMCLNAAAVFAFAGVMAVPVYLMRITELYYRYKENPDISYEAMERRRHPYMIAACILLIAGVLAVSYYGNKAFDEIFPPQITCPVIAHRAGGNEGAENCVAGLEKAAALGAWGSEIDIQRTKDGYYVLNHDSTFQRTAGVNKKTEDMTLEEVRALSVNGEPVPTLEEMLEASRDKIVLFIELKGNTADRQMADDTVRIVKEAGMEDQCVLISLQYDLIDYTEKTYPEIQTGYLTFLSFGNTAALNCDYLGLEEESATADAMNAIHAQGKKVLVWTPNEGDSQKHFLLSKADGIITDNVSQAFDIILQLENRTDFERILDGIFN